MEIIPKIDLPYDYIRYHNDCDHLMILDERLFIKKEFLSDININPLLDLTKIKIPNFLFPSKIFTDENEMFYYLVSEYLKNHNDFLLRLKEMSKKEIVLLFKKLLLSLQNAHENGFNPSDITFSNYLLDDNDNPIFVDIGDSFYNGESIYKYTNESVFDISFFGKERDQLTSENLILNDKINLLSMLIESLLLKYKRYLEPQDLVSYLEELKEKEILSKSVLNYLENLILRREVPNLNDYFIDDVIDPLIYGETSRK